MRSILLSISDVKRKNFVFWGSLVYYFSQEYNVPLKRDNIRHSKIDFVVTF